MAEFVRSLTTAGEMRANIRSKVLPLMLSGSIVCGVILAFLAQVQPWSLHADAFPMILALFSLIASAVVSRRYRAGIWLVVLGYLAISLLAFRWIETEATICLLVVPTGLATLLLGSGGGLAATLLLSSVLVFGGDLLGEFSMSSRMIALVTTWVSQGLIWAVLDSASEAISSSSAAYERMRHLLGSARDQRLRLKRTQQDLGQANLELARIADRLKSMREVADDARRAKEQFVANVSHELRTPLNMIIGFSEMIIQAPGVYGPELPPSLLADIDVIYRNSRHLSSLIDDVLDLSQIEAGRMALSKEPASLSSIVEEAIGTVGPLFEAKGLFQSILVADDLPELMCDRTRIRQVLLNLLSNAARFTEKGGITVRGWQEGNQVILSVTDTGPGIAPQDQDKVFEPFRQVDGSVSRRHEGSGLGLAISKDFVEMHEGKMWLESEVEVGTTFYFSLPVKIPPPTTPPMTRWFNVHLPYEVRDRRSFAPPPEVTPRLVVLDHGETIHHLLARHLDGAEIVSVQSAEEAVQQMTHTPAQALILNTPLLNEALSPLKGLSDLPYDTPVLACWVPGRHESAATLGAIEYLVKPVRRSALVSAVEKVGEKVETVLLVDDETEALQLFARTLISANRGYKVVRASNGHQALALLRSRRPDVMLLDLWMPGMDGFQVLAEKARDDAVRDIPVIVISAKDPMGEPVTSNALIVTRHGGLSVGEVSSCIEAISTILTHPRVRVDRAPQERPIDRPACAGMRWHPEREPVPVEPERCTPGSACSPLEPSATSAGGDSIHPPQASSHPER